MSESMRPTWHIDNNAYAQHRQQEAMFNFTTDANPRSNMQILASATHNALIAAQNDAYMQVIARIQELEAQTMDLKIQVGIERGLKKEYEQRASALEAKVKERPEQPPPGATSNPSPPASSASPTGFALPPLTGQVPTEDRKPEHKYWDSYQQFKTARNNARSTTPLKDFDFLTGLDGATVSSERLTDMRDYSNQLLVNVAHAGLAPYTWKRYVSAAASDYYLHHMALRFVEFRLCDNSWKGTQFAIKMYPEFGDKLDKILRQLPGFDYNGWLAGKPKTEKKKGNEDKPKKHKTNKTNSKTVKPGPVVNPVESAPKPATTAAATATGDSTPNKTPTGATTPSSIASLSSSASATGMSTPSAPGTETATASATTTATVTASTTATANAIATAIAAAVATASEAPGCSGSTADASTRARLEGSGSLTSTDSPAERKELDKPTGTASDSHLKTLDLELDDVNMDDSDVLKDVDMNDSLDGGELFNDSGSVTSLGLNDDALVPPNAGPPPDTGKVQTDPSSVAAPVSAPATATDSTVTEKPITERSKLKPKFTMMSVPKSATAQASVATPSAPPAASTTTNPVVAGPSADSGAAAPPVDSLKRKRKNAYDPEEELTKSKAARVYFAVDYVKAHPGCTKAAAKKAWEAIQATPEADKYTRMSAQAKLASKGV